MLPAAFEDILQLVPLIWRAQIISPAIGGMPCEEESGNTHTLQVERLTASKGLILNNKKWCTVCRGVWETHIVTENHIAKGNMRGWTNEGTYPNVPHNEETTSSNLLLYISYEFANTVNVNNKSQCPQASIKIIYGMCKTATKPQKTFRKDDAKSILGMTHSQIQNSSLQGANTAQNLPVGLNTQAQNGYNKMNTL